jgi:LysR family transcriptional regulator for metE and metH
MTLFRSNRIALEIRDLRLVEAVLRLGSLGRAAIELHRTPSALSHQLRDLERRAASRLFLRVGKRLAPTAVAKRLAERAGSILAATRLAEVEIGTAAADRAVIRVCTECYSCYAWLPSALRQLLSVHPHADVRLALASTFRPVAALLAGQIDLALVCTPGDDRRLRYWPVFRDELVVVVAPEHPLSAKRFVTARELAQERLFVAPGARGRSRLFHGVFGGEGLVPRWVTRIPLTEAILGMAREGLGVGIVPRWAAAAQVDGGLLRAARITPAGLEREWRAAIRADREVPRAVSDLIQLLPRSTP